MNKQLTKKTIGIAASAALIASVAFSGSALAAPPGKDKPEKQDPAQGTQTSVDVYSHCMIDGDDLKVFLTITDKNLYTDKSEAMLASVKVDGWIKTGPRDYAGPFDTWQWVAPDPYDPSLPDDRCADADINDANGDIIDAKGNTCVIILEDYAAFGTSGKALDALTTVQTGEAGSRVEYYTQCKDSDLKLD